MILRILLEEDDMEDEVAIVEVDSIMEGPAPSTSAYKTNEP